ncbi:D-alanyl-D-alanine carboxypeptidase [Chitinophagaceae bacterium LB-8]|uniref:D-alanyl-D-alanine carboxypeptidase n=1 Tax=Paraflavisolibacter caeni TaxID=2982496 RepID=A0A9X3B947_9BACT|nr:D-alanyl-D-alanine carboxypeptidase [Paraflavisolibacter caeni]MCU7551645.1 D-alanyl-D-alanine carboxypeptidase [Paraflavisolibacter caeni]
MKQYSILLILAAIVCSCGPARWVDRSAKEMVIHNKALTTAHTGISVYSPEEKKYLYHYQDEKYFVPASNVKIATCYAAMKYLGDSLTGAFINENDSVIHVYANGDPTFLSTTFSKHPLYNYLKQDHKKIYLHPPVVAFKTYGKGWSWDDYADPFMPSRSVFPMYDNLVRFEQNNGKLKITPSLVNFKGESLHNATFHKTKGFIIKRSFTDNEFSIIDDADSTKTYSEVPYQSSAWFGSALGLEARLLNDTLKSDRVFPNYVDSLRPKRRLHSQPTDSLLKPMMHRSDNFFAEQSLLMESNEVLGVMNDERIIDTLLKTDFKDLPQKPRWVDGSGLSRYNLFTPQDFVFILDKIQREFGMERVKEIFPTGNEGSLKNYFTSDSSFVYAKTGTLSGIVALSGYVYTRKNKLLIFSILVNNHQASSTEVRRAVERFILLLRKKL